METSPSSNSIPGHRIATKFFKSHDSTACTKFCSDRCVRIEVKAKGTFHRIWIVMKKNVSETGPRELGLYIRAHEPAVQTNLLLSQWISIKRAQTLVSITLTSSQKENCMSKCKNWNEFEGKMLFCAHLRFIFTYCRLKWTPFSVHHVTEIQ